MSDTDHLLPFRQRYTDYARKLLSDLGMAELEQPMRGRLLGVIEQYVAQTLINTILSGLDRTAIEGINDLLEQGKEQDEILTYIVASVPGIEQKVNEALESAYSKLLEETRQLTADLAQHHTSGALETATNPDTDASSVV